MTGAGGTGVVRRRGDLVTLAVSAASVVPLAVVARERRVPVAERAVFEAVNGLPRWLEPWLQPGLYVVQLVGLVGVPLTLAAFALAARRRRLALALALSLPLKELVEHGVLKQAVDRRRPAANEPGAILRRGGSAEGLAFPSGHAVVAFMVAGLVAPYLSRRARRVGFTLAGLVCVARVYLGAHNPLDVLAGAAVGLAIASLLNLVLGVPGARSGG